MLFGNKNLKTGIVGLPFLPLAKMFMSGGGERGWRMGIKLLTKLRLLMCSVYNITFFCCLSHVCTYILHSLLFIFACCGIILLFSFWFELGYFACTNIVDGKQG